MIYLEVVSHNDSNISNNLEYDLRAILKAFYPARDIVNKEADGAYARVYLTCTEAEVFLKVIIEDGIVIDKAFTIADDVKEIFDVTLYDELVRINGYELPWGILTGIRPTKIVYGLIDEGKSDEEAGAYLMDKYRVSSQKASLAVEIAKREKSLLDDIDYKNGYSLYIGIPFCPTTCLYCSFTSYPIALYKKKVGEYLDALIKEMDYVAELLKNKHLDSIYIGGGTPTTLEPAELDRLIGSVKSKFDISTIREFTVEAGRPDSITREKLEVLKAHGIDRISINPQTMNQKTLDIIGRRHTVEDIVNAYSLARECGFGNINMDLIVGLPGENEEDVRNTLEAVKKLGPDSLTVHSLALKRAARLNIKKEDYKEYTITNTDSIINMTRDYAKAMGLNPYYMYRQKNMAGNFENVGYSREGAEGIYNILIMEEKETIVAIGAGASTKIVYPDGNRIERVENVKDVNNYISRIDEMIERKEDGFKEVM